MQVLVIIIYEKCSLYIQQYLDYPSIMCNVYTDNIPIFKDNRGYTVYYEYTIHIHIL